MASAFTALGDFLKSIYELILSFFQTVFGLFENVISLIVNFFASVIHLFGDTAKGVFDVLGGVGNFLLTNAAIIGVLAVAGYGYLAYQKRQGQAVVVNGKKLN